MNEERKERVNAGHRGDKASAIVCIALVRDESKRYQKQQGCLLMNVPAEQEGCVG